MSYLIDLLLILLIVFISIRSAKKGFVCTVVEVAGYIAAIFIINAVSVPVSEYTYDKYIAPSVIETIEKKSEHDIEDVDKTIDAVWDEMPLVITKNDYFNVSKDEIIEKVHQQNVKSSGQLATLVSESYVRPPLVQIISLFVEIILLIILFFVVKFVAKQVNKLFSFSIVGRINKFLGGTLGIVKGAAITFLFCLIINLILPFSKDGFLIFTNEAINSTYIFKFFMGFSPF